jgi:DNA repair protein RadC
MSEFQFKEFQGYVGELTAIYKRTSKKSFKVNCSKDIDTFMRPYFDEILDDHEEMKVIYFSNITEVMHVKELSVGGLTGTLVDIRLILRDALILCTPAIALLHNHPSGGLRPSQADISLTEKIKKGAKLFDINVLDHLIMTRESYFSFADEGLI